jgi:hypothetical protein
MAPPMDDLGGLERRFDVTMRNINDEAARLRYRPTRFLEMVRELGSVSRSTGPSRRTGSTTVWPRSSFSEEPI